MLSHSDGNVVGFFVKIIGGNVSIHSNCRTEQCYRTLLKETAEKTGFTKIKHLLKEMKSCYVT